MWESEYATCTGAVADLVFDVNDIYYQRKWQGDSGIGAVMLECIYIHAPKKKMEEKKIGWSVGSFA